jgi:hypothetical protein
VIVALLSLVIIVTECDTNVAYFSLFTHISSINFENRNHKGTPNGSIIILVVVAKKKASKAPPNSEEGQSKHGTNLTLIGTIRALVDSFFVVVKVEQLHHPHHHILITWNQEIITRDYFLNEFKDIYRFGHFSFADNFRRYSDCV